MKGLYVRQRFLEVGKFFFLVGFLGLAACTEPSDPVIYKDITDVSRDGQYVNIDFEVKEAASYQFSLLFHIGATGYNDQEVKRRFNIFGGDGEKGKAIPVSLKINKEGKVFLYQEVNTVGTIGKHVFFHDDVTSSTMLRNIKVVKLPAGKYSAVITILKDSPEFNNIASLIYLARYKPENLASSERDVLKKKQEMDSDWNQYWRSTKWLVKGFFCAFFCSEPIVIDQPVDFSKAGQSVTYKFILSKDGGCQIDMLFPVGGEHNEMEKKSKLYGDIINPGINIPVALSLIKDKKTYYEKNIDTAGTSGSQNAYYEGKNVWSTVRRVKVLGLPPGNYSLTITTLKDLSDLTGEEGFFEFYIFDK